MKDTKNANNLLEIKMDPNIYQTIYHMPMDEECVEKSMQFAPDPSKYKYHQEAEEYFTRMIVGYLLLRFGKEKLEKLYADEYDEEFDDMSVIEQFIYSIRCMTEDFPVSCALAKAKEFDDAFEI